MAEAAFRLLREELETSQPRSTREIVPVEFVPGDTVRSLDATRRTAPRKDGA
jgi:hypothetical protein